MSISATLKAIPQPPAKFLVGNLLDIGTDHVQELMNLARTYGPIYQLDLPGRHPFVVVSGFELVDELCAEKRFDKKVWTPLRKVRKFAGDGLFTSETQEPNWHKAHNILLPNFSLKAMQGYFPMMLDISEQMLNKWARLNPHEEIDVTGDMTRLTLDTIGLCGFDYRFNSFYRESLHPFVQSMVRALGETMESGGRLPIQNRLMLHKRAQMRADIDLMYSTVDSIIQERKHQTDLVSGKKDFLSYMLTGIDKESGTQLDETNIRYQIITFLIAGHETTSGLLSFALHFLLQNPEVLAKAYAEVDRVLGPDPASAPTFAQINRLKYIGQILKETLRLWPTAPMFSVYPYEETTIGGMYPIDKENDCAILIPMLHRDKSVWGEDAELFNPDHFTVEAEQARPANAYKPFGNGQRACIGRQFALQEATLVLGMLLQRFKLYDPHNYQLKIKETLTLKPENFKIQVLPRTAVDRSSPAIIQQTAPVVEVASKSVTMSTANKHHTPLLVLFGSNLGSAEDLAHRIAEDGSAAGFDAVVAPLDEYVNKLPTSGALIVVTASYNGTPPDNAVKFCNWIQSDALPTAAFKGVQYAVFGCGNREWASTFQAIPRLIDSELEKHGAQRIYGRGDGDASDDFDGQFQRWYQPLWSTVAETLSIDLGQASTKAPLYEVEVISDEQTLKPFVASYGAQALKLLTNRELHTKNGEHPSERSTRHIEVALPEDVTYRAGDHLGVIASNRLELVQRVATHFSFGPKSRIRLHQNSKRKTYLPIDESIQVFDLLSDYVELQDVATRSQIQILAEHTQCPPDKKKLRALSGEDETSIARYRAEVLTPRKSLIDLLEEFPACELPFNVYLQLLVPIRPRYYSISSSPLQEREHCSITVAVVDSPARSGHGQFEGLCSSYLERQAPGDVIYGFVRDTGSAFRLAANSATALIMVGPGTGLAPFRGFLQERAALKALGQPIGPSLLFFGCRHPEQDFLYEDELKAFATQGVTELFTAFSRWTEHPGALPQNLLGTASTMKRGGECCDSCSFIAPLVEDCTVVGDYTKQYVQDQIRAHKERVWQLIEQGAVIYICGDAGHMATDVKHTFTELYSEMTGKSAHQADLWLHDMTNQKRYLVDVWAAN